MPVAHPHTTTTTTTHLLFTTTLNVGNGKLATLVKVLYMPANFLQFAPPEPQWADFECNPHNTGVEGSLAKTCTQDGEGEAGGKTTQELFWYAAFQLGVCGDGDGAMMGMVRLDGLYVARWTPHTQQTHNNKPTTYINGQYAALGEAAPWQCKGKLEGCPCAIPISGGHKHQLFRLLGCLTGFQRHVHCAPLGAGIHIRGGGVSRGTDGLCGGVGCV